MAHTHCMKRDLGTGAESKWVTIFYAELSTLHWNRERDQTPLGFIQMLPFPLPVLVPVPCSVSEPVRLHLNQLRVCCRMVLFSSASVKLNSPDQSRASVRTKNSKLVSISNQILCNSWIPTS